MDPNRSVVELNTTPPIGELSKTITISNEPGLHVRVAAKLSTVAQLSKSDVWVSKENRTVDGKSVIAILTLACGVGSCVTIGVCDPADSILLDRMVDIIEKECNGFPNRFVSSVYL